MSPCQGGFPSSHQNSENTETYTIWPYEFFAINRTNNDRYPLSVGLNTFNNVHFGHTNTAWRYDGQDAALLGVLSRVYAFLVFVDM